MATEASDRTIVLHLLRGAVPERAGEISGLWRQYGHAVEVAPSTKGVTMNADASRIKFDTKTIDLFWLLGFSAWRAIEVYSPGLVLATLTGIPLDLAGLDQRLDPLRVRFGGSGLIGCDCVQTLPAASRFGPRATTIPRADRAARRACRICFQERSHGLGTRAMPSRQRSAIDPRNQSSRSSTWSVTMTCMPG